MKCLSCEKETDVRALFCDGCGAMLPHGTQAQHEPLEPCETKSAPQPQPWGILDVIAVGVGGLFLCLIPIAIDLLLSSGALKSILHNNRPFEIEMPPGFILRSVVFQNAILVGVCFLWLWVVRHQGPAALGLRRASWRNWLWQGLLAGVVLCVLGELIPYLTQHALLLVGMSRGDLQHLDANSPQAQLIAAILKSPPAMKALAVLIIAGVAPVGEEILFRGFAYQGIKNRLGSKWGTALSSLAFAAVHSNIPAFVAYFVLGLILVWLFQRTKSLTVPIIAHSLNNLVGLFMLLHAH